MYKILRIKEIEHENECTELELYDPDREFTMLWESTKDEKLKDIYTIICKELRRISKISDEDLKRKCLKAMYLKCILTRTTIRWQLRHSSFCSDRLTA